MRQWLRKYRVSVGEVQTDSLDVTFKIKRTLQPTPGTCELTVFNLNESHRSALTHLRRPPVRVEAGYAEGMSVLFQGDARRIDLVRDGTDWQTNVLGGDGYYAFRQARASRSFGPDTRLEDVVRALADSMGLGIGNASDAIAGASLDNVGQTFPGGTVVHGAAARNLTRLLHSAGLEWSCQDGVLQVVPRGAALARSAVRLTSDTGMIGSPEKGKDGVVSVKALLSPDLVPGRLVSLESAVVRGTFRIETAEYEGDTTSSEDWTASLTMRTPRAA